MFLKNTAAPLLFFRSKFGCLIVILLSVLAFAGCATQQPAEKGFVSLFDGSSLKGWESTDKNNGNYFVENGALVCPPKGGGDLFTDREYSDFILRVDFKMTRSANNGIALRSPFEKGQIAYIGNEIQIIDDDNYKGLKPGQNCGSLYRIFAAKPGAVKPAGEWNSYEITARGRYIKVVLNGQPVVEGNLDDVTDLDTIRRHPGMFRPKGRIGLLGHGSRVEFRNIRIYEFPKYFETENSAPAGFTSLFNGRDLTGWRGLVADPVKRQKMGLDEWAREQLKADDLMRKNWKIENRSLTYRGDGFDNLCTEKQYGNFEMLADWKIDPRADSGIYLRGCPQVQIWEPKSGGFDPKHPGSGGLFNNKKTPNYPDKFADHYVGEWNRFRIIMAGERVHVFLNNQLVVDNRALENYWERDKPVYSFGPIELQAHTTPVYFKNIYVREILPAAEGK